MPFILVVLFAIALLVTVAGLFLSSRSVTATSRNGFSAMSERRKVVGSAQLSLREERKRSETADIAAQRRQPMTATMPRLAREDRYSTGAFRSPVPQRASRGSGVSGSPVNIVARRPVAGPVNINPPVSRTGPKYQGGFLERPGSWKVVVPALFALFLLALYLLSLLFPHQAIWTSVWFGSSNSAPTPTTLVGSSTVYTASRDLIRLGQLDPAQYQTTQEYNIWAYSACSAAAITEVINAYGHTYRITDILEVEAKIHEITPDLGLLEESGIAHTGNQFHFKTTWGHNLSLAQIITVANSGSPVIVSFPPSRFPGGHLLVVRGGDDSYVNLADSSRLNMTQMTRDRFMQLWGGFSATMLPA